MCGRVGDMRVFATYICICVVYMCVGVGVGDVRVSEGEGDVWVYMHVCVGVYKTEKVYYDICRCIFHKITNAP